MKKFFSSPDSPEIGLLRSMLDEAGIPCEVRNDHVSAAMPWAPFYPELWLLNDDDYPRAGELLAAWKRPSASGASSWTCSRCGEVLEGPFASCWKCGANREAEP